MAIAIGHLTWLLFERLKVQWLYRFLRPSQHVRKPVEAEGRGEMRGETAEVPGADHLRPHGSQKRV